jgi:hypothetical protein
MAQAMIFTTQNLARPVKNILTKHNYYMDMLNLQISLEQQAKTFLTLTVQR